MLEVLLALLPGRRVMAAMVCRDWAAAHADVNSGIWEAADLRDSMFRADLDAANSSAVASMSLWLSRRLLVQLRIVDGSFHAGFSGICKPIQGPFQDLNPRACQVLVGLWEPASHDSSQFPEHTVVCFESRP